MSDDSKSSYFARCEHNFKPLLNGLDPEDTILELGCGPGYMLEFLKRFGFKKVKGIDISSEGVELSKKRGCDAEVADVFAYLEGKQNTFDSIIAVDFIEHFTKDELLSLTRLIFDSLKKGGRLILQTVNGEGLFPNMNIYGDLTHSTIFTTSSMMQMLRLVGFDNFHFVEYELLRKKRNKLAWKLVKYVATKVRGIETGQSHTFWAENMICYCDKCIP